MTPEMNWAGNVQYGASRVMHPTSLNELQGVVATNELVRPLGSRHSFSTIADSEGILVSLASLPRAVEVDAAAKTATVAAGMTYGEVAIELHRQGWGLHNLASLGHIAVAGACATATHGSGDRNQCLSTAVRAMTVVDSQGELCELAPHLDGDRFRATQAGLGGLGMVVSASLAVEPTYDVAQRVYLDLPFATFVTNYEEILASAYSVSLFTDYRAAALYSGVAQTTRLPRRGAGVGRSVVWRDGCHASGPSGAGDEPGRHDPPRRSRRSLARATPALSSRSHSEQWRGDSVGVSRRS